MATRYRPVFDEQYMRRREFIAWRGPVVTDALIKLFSPRTFLDVGCGPGEIVECMLNRGVDAYGLDSSPSAFNHIQADHRCLPEDICRKLTWFDDDGERWTFDLVLCLEVFSVLGPVGHDIAVKNIRTLCGRWLVTNQIEPEALVGFAPHPELTARLRQALEPWQKTQAVKALQNTGSVYKRL